MEYLEIKSSGIEISKSIPIALLTEAIELIESTEIDLNSGIQIEVCLQDGFLQLIGEGVVSDIDSLICGLDIIRDYLDANCSINISHKRWETTVSLDRQTH